MEIDLLGEFAESYFLKAYPNDGFGPFPRSLLRVYVSDTLTFPKKGAIVQVFRRQVCAAFERVRVPKLLPANWDGLKLTDSRTNASASRDMHRSKWHDSYFRSSRRIGWMLLLSSFVAERLE